MALSQHVDKVKVNLRIIQNDNIYEVVVKDDITLTRSPNTASKLTCSIQRDHITVERGNCVQLVLDDHHFQFFGYVIETTKTEHWCQIEAYDQLWYMAQNKTRLAYRDLRADQILTHISGERHYGTGTGEHIENTGYIVPARVEENVEDLTIVQTALDLTEKNTGIKYYLWDDAGTLCLNSERWLAGEPNITISLGYIEDYAIKETLNGCHTRVRLEKKGKEANTYSTYTRESIELEQKFGTIELFDNVEEGENGDEVANQYWANNKINNMTLELTGVQGDITVRGGTPLLVDFFTGDRKEYLRGWFRCTSVTHHISTYHTMDLTLEKMKMLDNWGNTDPNYYSHPAIN